MIMLELETVRAGGLLAHAVGTICAHVKIEIKQELTLELIR
jgi:hypothetical protein